MRRMLGEVADRPRRAHLLPAFVEIMLAVHELEAAQEACLELEEIAQQYGSTMLIATAAHASGAVRLTGGDASGALAVLRSASQAWEELEAPYETARTRVLLGLACRELGDDETATFELAAARETFTELGAAPEIRRVDSLLGESEGRDVRGLTTRELEVLRLVAAGTSNRGIAATLVISEHTVARHLQNIFAKLGVSSRTAASAFAYEHDLI
jgi:ATP/maltotriose-dependent transcriptional regulator MalT